MAGADAGETGYENLTPDDGPVSGYILDGGNIIPIDTPKIESLNKFAYDVIKMQVKDHFEALEEGQEADLE